jgi:hypothetical protein
MERKNLEVEEDGYELLFSLKNKKNVYIFWPRVCPMHFVPPIIY